MWDKTIGGSGDDWLTSIQQNERGAYIVGGHSNSNISGEKSLPSRGSYDYWVVRVRANGTFFRSDPQFTIGGSGDDKLTSLHAVRSGYVLGGYSSSNRFGEKLQNSFGNYDFWISIQPKDTDEDPQSITIGGASADYLNFVRQITGNTVIAGGTSYSSSTGCKLSESRGQADYWIVAIKLFDRNPEEIAPTVTSTTDLTVTPDKNKVFRTYPVPATNILRVEGNTSATYSLTDLTGKVLLTKNITGNGTIDVSQLRSGLYYLKNNTTGAVQKVVVSK